MKTKIYNKILIFLVCTLVFSYVGYQLYQANNNPVKTVTAVKSNISDYAETTLFVVRDENYIINSAKGILLPLVHDGKRVANGDELAAVFSSNAQVENYKKIALISGDIERYSRLLSQRAYASMDIESVDSEIKSLLVNCLDAGDSGNMNKYADAAAELRDKLNFRQILVGQSLNVAAKKSNLENQLAGLKSAMAAYDYIKSPSSGYYISSTDGFEKTCLYDSVPSATVEQIEGFINAQKAEAPENVTGKLVNSFVWYMLCNIDSKNAGMLEKGDVITVELEGSAAGSVKTEVFRINDSTDGKIAVVLKCTEMNDALATLRIEKARLILKEYQGYKIDNRAIRFDENGAKGVYILRGNLVSFRKINIVYENEQYSVVKNIEEESGHLQLYDELIVEGKDIYDGKIIR